MNKNNNIDIYKTIYDLDLAVCRKNYKIKNIINTYERLNGDPLDEKLFDDSTAFTFACRNKETKVYTIVVAINKTKGKTRQDKNADLTNSISHEAAHVVLETYAKIMDNVSVDHQEPFAYYLGWVAECIYRTYNK